MKNILKYIIVMVVIGGGLSSCDDFLTQVDPNNLNTDVFWENLDDTEATLNSAYASLRKPGITNMMEEARRADMGWPGYGYPTPDKVERTLWYYHTYSNSNAELEARWADNYEGIFRANQVIDALNNKVTRTAENEEAWDIQMGQAKFLRGLYHFYLYSTFNEGSIIIHDFAPSSIEEIHLPLSPADSVFDFFINDLKEAYTLLPATYSETTDQGRVTKGAAATILGIAHVYHDNDYASAMPYFDDVINNSDYGYELEQDLSLMFTTEGEYNSESILEVGYSNTERTDISSAYNDDVMSNRFNDNSTGTDAAYVPAWLAYEYKSEPMDIKDERNYWDSIYVVLDTIYEIIDPTVIDTIKEVEQSVKVLRYVPLRASAMVTLVEDEQTTYYITGNVPDNMKSSANNGWGFSMYKKFTNHDIIDDENNLPRGRQFSGKNVVLNRLSEVYLLQAESIIQTGGDIQEALDLINAIRMRWGLELLGPDNGDVMHTYNDSTYTATTLMDQIMYVEKPLELSVEGQCIRWNDMRRWGITKERFKQLSEETYYKVDYTYWSMKLDKSAVKKNQAIVKDPTGYSKSFEIYYEYDNTYEIYNPELHDYLPIPLSEIMNNPNID